MANDVDYWIRYFYYNMCFFLKKKYESFFIKKGKIEEIQLGKTQPTRLKLRCY